MMLVLTYHEVRESAGEEKVNFYTISPRQLAQHLATLAARGLQPARLEELLEPDFQPANKYLLTFDDGTVDHYEVVFPLLEKHRCQGSFFIPTAKLNQPGYVTDAQVREMVAAGHAIGSHSHVHQRLDLLPEDELRNQISQSQKILSGIVRKPIVAFVPPGGFMNERIARVAHELGMRMLRTMRWGYNPKLNLMALETVPVNRYAAGNRFLKLLDPRSKPFLYGGKEVMKRLLPLRQYEWLRGQVFKFRKSN